MPAILSALFLLLTISILEGSEAATPTGESGDPPPHREEIEWCDIWITDGAGTSLPRVLLIGDSITRGYYPQVAEKLSGKASVSRLATSKSVGDPALLREVKLVLQEYHWDVIHFNNGLHGWDYTEDDFRRSYPLFVEMIRQHAPNAKLICATSTPIYMSPSLTQLDPKTQRVIVRNEIAVDTAAKHHISVDDLFALMAAHPEYYYTTDGAHPNEQGYTAEATQVADSIAPLLQSITTP